jgi:hypothetical protein
MSILLDGDLAGMLHAGKAGIARNEAVGKLNGPRLVFDTAAVQFTNDSDLREFVN